MSAENQNAQEINPLQLPVNSNKSELPQVTRNKPKIKQSILSKNILVRGENTRKFEEFRLKVEGEIQPITEIEKILCDKFILASWKHQRAMEVERNILNDQNKPENDWGFDEWRSGKKHRMRNLRNVRMDRPEIQKLLRYQLELEKNMYKALERLRVEQSIRLGKGDMV